MNGYDTRVTEKTVIHDIQYLLKLVATLPVFPITEYMFGLIYMGWL